MREKVYAAAMLIIFLIVVALYVEIILPKLTKEGIEITGRITTGARINTPPEFNHTPILQNKTWKEDTILSNTFNLNQHFYDLDNDNFEYTPKGNSSIQISISNGLVTFTPTPNWNGIENIYFIGDDGNRRNATSNNITLNVTPETDIFWNQNGTNFSQLNLTNPFNLTLYNSLANISWISQINFTENASQGQDVNLTPHINISYNRIFVNSTAIPSLNQSATLTLSSLSFNNPRILRNNEICPSTICTELSYTDNELKFNVTSFTVYEAEETPSDAAGPGGRGTGGGKAVVMPKIFTLDKETIKVSLRQAEKKRDFFTIKNEKNSKLAVTINLSDLKEFLVFESFLVQPILEFTLEPKQEQVIQLTFKTKEDQQPETYIQSITVKAGTNEQKILTIIDVDAAKALFDINLRIPQEYKEIIPCGTVIGEIILFNIKETGKVDVKVDFYIEDLQGNLITKKSRTVGVEITTSFIESFSLSNCVEEGQYLLIAKVTYNNQTNVASELFRVVEKRYLGITSKTAIIIFVSIALLLLLAFLILIILSTINLKRKKSRQKRVTKKELTRKQATEKFEKLYSLLSKAHKEVYSGKKENALNLYIKIKKDFESMPLPFKRIIYKEIQKLVKEMRKKRIL